MSAGPATARQRKSWQLRGARTGRELLEARRAERRAARGHHLEHMQRGRRALADHQQFAASHLEGHKVERTLRLVGDGRP